MYRSAPLNISPPYRHPVISSFYPPLHTTQPPTFYVHKAQCQTLRLLCIYSNDMQLSRCSSEIQGMPGSDVLYNCTVHITGVCKELSLSDCIPTNKVLTIWCQWNYIEICQYEHKYKRRWDPRSSKTLHSVHWHLIIEVSGQPISSI